MSAHLSWSAEQELIADTIASFPPEFELRAFRGRPCRLSRQSSYFSDGKLVLVVQIKNPGCDWSDLAKGSVEELRREIVS